MRFLVRTVFMAAFMLLVGVQSGHAGWLDSLGQSLTRAEVVSTKKVGSSLVITSNACETGVPVSEAALETQARQEGAKHFGTVRGNAAYQNTTFSKAEYQVQIKPQMVGTKEVGKCAEVVATRTFSRKAQTSSVVERVRKKFNKPTLRICYRNMPGVSFSDRGDPQGPAIMFGNAIGAALDKRVKWNRIAKPGDRETRLGKLCEMVISTYTWSDARQAKADKANNVLSEPYYADGLVARAMNPELTAIDSMEAFNGIIVTTKSTVVNAFIDQNFPKAKKVQVSTTGRILGKMKAMIKTNPDTPVITVYPEMILSGYPELLPVEVEGVKRLTDADNYVVLIHSESAFLKELVDHVITEEGVENYYYEAAGR